MTVDRPLVVEFAAARKDWGAGITVGPLDLTIRSGETVAVVGQNGAGKTTLLRLAAGLYDLSSGRVDILSSPAGSQSARAAVTFIPDTPILFEDISIREQCVYVAALSGLANYEDRIEELLGRLGLTDRADDVPGRFSLGMRQKASVALAFARPFHVLLADEPFRGVDIQGATTIAQLLVEASQFGATVLASTHHLEWLEIFSRMVGIADGMVRYDGLIDSQRASDLSAPEST